MSMLFANSRKFCSTLWVCEFGGSGLTLRVTLPMDSVGMALVTLGPRTRVGH